MSNTSPFGMGSIVQRRENCPMEARATLRHSVSKGQTYRISGLKGLR